RGLIREEPLQGLRIEAWKRDDRSDTRNEEQRQRIEDALAQLGDLQRVRESGEHGTKFSILEFRFSILKRDGRQLPRIENRQSKIENQSPSGDDGLAASLLDLLLGGGREFRGGDLQGAVEIAIAENLHVGLAVANQPSAGQAGSVDLGDRGIEPVEVGDIDDRRFNPESGLVEAAVRQLAVEGHLAAFK